MLVGLWVTRYIFQFTSPRQKKSYIRISPTSLSSCMCGILYLKIGLGNSTPQSLFIMQLMCMFSSTFSTFSKWWCEPSSLLTGWIIQQLQEWRGGGGGGGANSVMMVRVPTTTRGCLLKQSRLFHWVLQSWDSGLWYVNNSVNKELVIFNGVQENLGPSLWISWTLLMLNSVPLQIYTTKYYVTCTHRGCWQLKIKVTKTTVKIIVKSVSTFTRGVHQSKWGTEY
jgi:hypothetical protein